MPVATKILGLRRRETSYSIRCSMPLLWICTDVQLYFQVMMILALIAVAGLEGKFSRVLLLLRVVLPAVC